VLNSRDTKRYISAVDTISFGSVDISEQEYLNDDCYAFMDTEDYMPDQAMKNIGAVTVEDAHSQCPSANAGDQFGQRSRLHPPVDQSRYIGMFETSSRRILAKTFSDITIARVNAIIVPPDQNQESFIELNSHMDTS
jgi:hypothetical protein